MASKASLEKRKLELEIKKLQRPWYLDTFSWATILGFATLFAVWSSGLLDAKRERLFAERARLAQEGQRLQDRIERKAEELDTLEKSIRGAKEHYDAIEFLTANGCGVSVHKSPFSDGEIYYELTLPMGYAMSVSDSGVESVGKPARCTAELVEAARVLPNVRTLRLGVFGAEAKLPDLVRALPRLWSLDLAHVGEADEELVAAIGRSRQLQTLSISVTTMTGAQLKKIISSCRDLAELSLGRAVIDDSMANALRELPAESSLDITELDISKGLCEELTSKGVFLIEGDEEVLWKGEPKDTTVEPITSGETPARAVSRLAPQTTTPPKR